MTNIAALSRMEFLRRMGDSPGNNLLEMVALSGQDRAIILPADCRNWAPSCKIKLRNEPPRGFGSVMAQQCEICGKKPQAGNRISHAHNVTKRRWNVNLRPVHAKVAGQGKRIRVCTSCLRSGKVVKA
jgi:large subunit ribosomal protein L28